MQIGEQQRLVAWRVASAVWFDGDKDSINLRQRFGIVKLQNPTLLGSIMNIKDALHTREFSSRYNPFRPNGVAVPGMFAGRVDPICSIKSCKSNRTVDDRVLVQEHQQPLLSPWLHSPDSC